MKREKRVVPVYLELLGEKVLVGNIDITHQVGVPGGGYVLPHLEPMVEVTLEGQDYQIWLVEMILDEDNYKVVYYTSPMVGKDVQWHIETNDYEFTFNPPEEILVEGNNDEHE